MIAEQLRTFEGYDLLGLSEVYKDDAALFDSAYSHSCSGPHGMP